MIVIAVRGHCIGVQLQRLRECFDHLRLGQN